MAEGASATSSTVAIIAGAVVGAACLLAIAIAACLVGFRRRQTHAAKPDSHDVALCDVAADGSSVASTTPLGGSADREYGVLNAIPAQPSPSEGYATIPHVRAQYDWGNL